MKALTQPAPAAEPLETGELAQLDAIENDQPERPQLTGPGTTTDAQHASPAELRLEDARKLTRDNPAAVANIVKAWMNGEAPA
jgi:flagellar M-ring protein FliF